MPRLSVNVNKIALLRNARGGQVPDLKTCSEIIIAAGADGITVHPRPDLRHILPSDVIMLAHLTKAKGVEFNIEGNPASGRQSNGYPGFIALVEETQPDQCTLVPDADDQLTSDHGWDLSSDSSKDLVRSAIREFHPLDIRVSLFMDPVCDQIRRAAELGADCIELFTGPYAEMVSSHGIGADDTLKLRDRYSVAAKAAHDAGLEINAGHDLDLANLREFCEISGLSEVSIGQALIADALVFGLHGSVRKYLEITRSFMEPDN